MKTLFVLVFLCALLLSGCERKPEVKPPPGSIGSSLPHFETQDLYGERLSWKDLQNKVALIDFWAPWCAPCRKEMPGYQQLLDRYGPQGFVVIGLKVDVMADPEDPVSFAKGLGVHYPIAIAPATLRDKFGPFEGLPTTLIYDRRGILRNKIIGFEYTSKIEAIVKSLL